jgi:hypothetical protein
VIFMNKMFFLSKFNKDISNWKPYRLDKCKKMFSEYDNSIPYWAKIENVQHRNKAIDSYHLYKELNNQLNINNTSSPKIKL